MFWISHSRRNSKRPKVSPHMALWMGFTAEKIEISVAQSTLSGQADVESDMAAFSSAYVVRQERLLS
jgi:hypothetical protein